MKGKEVSEFSKSLIVIGHDYPNEVLTAFEKNPEKEIVVFYPGSGSWCEGFRTKEDYLTRESASMAYSDYMRDHCPDGKCDKTANLLIREAIRTKGRYIPASVVYEGFL